MRRDVEIAAPALASLVTIGVVLTLTAWPGVPVSGGVRVPPTSHPAQGAATDRFEGIPPQVADRAGSFRLKKLGDRWVFVTPEGNAFWMLGVYTVDSSDSTDDLGGSYSRRILHKYGDKTTWAEQTVKRLKAWGFNTLGEYSTWYVLPTKSPYSDWSNPEKVPFVLLIRPSYYGLTNREHCAPGPFKDLIAGTDPAIYKDWRGSTIPDVFDPNFETCVDGSLAAISRDVLSSPWLIGIATDDADDLFGFGPGPEVSAARLHAHVGWLVLVGNFQQTSNARLGVHYSDPKVYSKFALRDFLRSKYGEIKALNAAWGSSYTTWDSDGGWPSGKGFLDESGRSRWVGNDSGRLRTAAPAVRGDLDHFLGEFAQRYFSVSATRIREHAPKHLAFGPAALNGWGGLTRREILQAAGKYLDVLQVNVPSQKVLDLTAQYAGDIPIVTWEGETANPDSGLWRYKGPSEGVPILQTQQERGRTYAQRTQFLLHARAAAGTYPIVGLKFWAFTDSWSEKTNWGLVTLQDNAYDGKEAVVSAGKDPWRFPTGGEERNYGDFISAVEQGNFALTESLRKELASGVGPGTSKASTMAPKRQE